MTNPTSNTGPTIGGDSQATAGSQLPQGDRRCLRCHGSKYEPHPEYATALDCTRCQGTGVEPEGASLPSASVLSPPVPCSDASWAASADPYGDDLIACGIRYRAARMAFPRSGATEADKMIAGGQLLHAAIRFVEQRRRLAEGGDNAD